MITDEDMAIHGEFEEVETDEGSSEGSWLKVS